MSKRKDALDALRRKQEQREARRLPVRAQDEVAVRLREIVTAMEEGPIAEFPEACYASAARPDVLKFEFATQAEDEEPGRSKLKRLERQYRRGKLGFLPEIEHWAMEEFFWHGAPGDVWHALESFLRRASCSLTRLPRFRIYCDPQAACGITAAS